jgi:hypothetical protein
MKSQGVDMLGQSEIANSHAQPRGIVANEYILWFDVAVDDRWLLAMCYCQTSAALSHDLHHGFHRDESRSVRPPELLQATSGDILHGEEAADAARSFGRVRVKNTNEIWVA